MGNKASAQINKDQNVEDNTCVSSSNIIHQTKIVDTITGVKNRTGSEVLKHSLHDITKSDEVKEVVCINDKKAPPNILLVGSTGSGKSSFGNWLYNFGTGKELFPVGKDMATCTQKVERHVVNVPLDVPSISHEFVRVSLIDTPGLNELDPQTEVENMTQLLKTVHFLKHISLVVLCVNFSSKLDVQTVETLRYYKDLLQPLFAAGNVWMILTHCSSDDYARYQKNDEWKKVVEQKKNDVKKTLDLDDMTCLFVNSAPNPSELEELLKVGMSKYAPPKQNLLQESAATRDMVLRIVSGLTPVSMEGHKFKLPPCVEKKRICFLQAFQDRIQQVVEKLGAEDLALKEKICAENVLKDKIDKTTNEIVELESKKEMKSRKQFTPAILVQGNTWIGGKIEEVGYNLQLESYVLLAQKHNCQVTEVHNGQRIAVKVIPDKIHFLKRDASRASFSHEPETPSTTPQVLRRWFARIQLEYSGEKFFQEDICKLTSEISQKQDEIVKWRKEYEQTLAEHRKQDEAITVHQKFISALNDEKSPIMASRFVLGYVPDLLQKLDIEVMQKKKLDW